MTTTRTSLSATTDKSDKKTSSNNNTAAKSASNTADYYRFFQCVYENIDPEKQLFNSCVDEYKRTRKSST